MKIDERKKYLNIIEHLNTEFANNGVSSVFIKNLDRYFEYFGQDGEALMFLLKNIKCDDVQKQHIVSRVQDKIVDNIKFDQDDSARKDAVQYVYQIAKYAVGVDFARLTSRMLAVATESELIKLAQIKGVDVMAICNKFTDDEKLKFLQELHKVVPLKFKKMIAEDIKYLKEEGVIISQY